ncbi:hypothetical protein EBB79_08255 [Parasedimentitalea marina]|uniref:Uncharacterized protein n=1 Tax=Parasedimentitalea marina TaxID=2483033 RepID=A0A3T0N1I5_9RHOB|nr:hypothetical protein [Parasedimentitalea marina]AZV77888.1 hypothetical protein EBB79_08255 [Parasedimentitalea marina]
MSKKPVISKHEYTVTAAGWVAGQRCKAGDTLSLTKDQARYENVRLKTDQDNEPAKTATPKKAKAKT